MLRYTTASDLIADLRRYYHPDEPLLIVSVSGQDIKQRLADKYPDDDCGEPTESSIVAAMRQVESAMQRSDEDARLEDRVIDALPEATAPCDGCDKSVPMSTIRVCGNAEQGPFGFCPNCIDPNT
jgi:hypothetical protein